PAHRYYAIDALHVKTPEPVSAVDAYPAGTPPCGGPSGARCAADKSTTTYAESPGATDAPTGATDVSPYGVPSIPLLAAESPAVPGATTDTTSPDGTISCGDDSSADSLLDGAKDVKNVNGVETREQEEKEGADDRGTEPGSGEEDQGFSQNHQ